MIWCCCGTECESCPQIVNNLQYNVGDDAPFGCFDKFVFGELGINYPDAPPGDICAELFGLDTHGAFLMHYKGFDAAKGKHKFQRVSDSDGITVDLWAEVIADGPPAILRITELTAKNPQATLAITCNHEENKSTCSCITDAGDKAVDGNCTTCPVIGMELFYSQHIFDVNRLARTQIRVTLDVGAGGGSISGCCECSDSVVNCEFVVAAVVIDGFAVQTQFFGQDEVGCHNGTFFQPPANCGCDPPVQAHDVRFQMSFTLFPGPFFGPLGFVGTGGFEVDNCGGLLPCTGPCAGGTPCSCTNEWNFTGSRCSWAEIFKDPIGELDTTFNLLSRFGAPFPPCPSTVRLEGR